MADRTLLVRLHSLGDVVLASGAAAVVSETSPVTFITRSEYLPVAERFKGNVEPVSLSGGWRELRKYSAGFSTICDLQNNLTTKLAFAGRDIQRHTMNRKLRSDILKGRDGKLQWRALEYLNTCLCQGNPMPVLSRKSFPVPGRITVGIVAGGRWKMKSIPSGVVSELSRLFCDVCGGEVKILGGAQDIEISRRIVEECGYREVESLAGKGDVASLISTVEGLDLLVSPDSGPAHLAMALGVPSLVLFTSTSPLLGFYPPGMKNAFMVNRVTCRPCHRHGGNTCAAGDSVCRNRMVPREIFEAARCQMH